VGHPPSAHTQLPCSMAWCGGAMCTPVLLHHHRCHMHCGHSYPPPPPDLPTAHCPPLPPQAPPAAGRSSRPMPAWGWCCTTHSGTPSCWCGSSARPCMPAAAGRPQQPGSHSHHAQQVGQGGWLGQARAACSRRHTLPCWSSDRQCQLVACSKAPRGGGVVPTSIWEHQAAGKQ
jgi:hypothetical protein